MLEAKESSYLIKYDGNIQYKSDHLPVLKKESMPLTLNFSLLEDYFECPYRFKLSMFYGFVQPLIPALGHGNAMHAIVRRIHLADMGDGIRVNGRIDLVKQVAQDGLEKTAIIDFKTANKQVKEEINTQQLKIYALGYRELTGKTADYMEIYHLDSQNSASDTITPDVITAVTEDIKNAADHIRNNHLPRKCSKEKCSRCHLNYLCLGKKEQKKYVNE